MAANLGLPTKRKRNAVSYYAEESDHDLDGTEEGSTRGVDQDTNVAGDNVDEDEDDDSDFHPGMRRSKKPKSSKSPKKKARSTAKKSQKDKEPQPFRFLSLPRELRDEIYRMALTDPNGVSLGSTTKDYRRILKRMPVYLNDEHLHFGPQCTGRCRRPWGKDPDNGPRRSLSPKFLTANRQICSEASEFLYKQPIAVADPKALHLFLTSIGPTNLSLLADITVLSWGTHRGATHFMNVAGLAALATCTNLKRLNLDCCLRSRWLSAVGMARRMYRDGHSFFEAFGRAKGKKDAVMDVLKVGDLSFTTSHLCQDGSLLSEPQIDTEKKKDFEAHLSHLLLKP